MVRTTLGLVALLALQNPPLPVPTVPGTSVIVRPVGQSPTGHGEIRGRILDARTKQAIAGARMTVSSTDPRVQATAVSDATGRYRVFGLPAARYTMLAISQGFVTGRFGDAPTYDSWKLVDLKADDTLDNIDLSMSAGGQITGTVLNESGSPVGGVFVTPLRRSFIRGISHLFQAGTRVLTDNRGGFSFSQLVPGEYYISAGPSNSGIEIYRGVSRPFYGMTYYPGTLIRSNAGACP